MLAVILHLKYLDNYRFRKFTLFLILSFYFGYYLNFLFELESCPNCYGDDLCPAIRTQQIRLSFFSYLTFILSPKLTKSVFYGIINGSEWVVLKRKYRRIYEPLHNQPSKIFNKFYAPESHFFCSGFRNLNWFFKFVGESVDEKYPWLNLNASIEPLLLRYFQSLGNWPVPRYLGACGDVIVEEYKGLPLTNYLSGTLQQRIILSFKLLEFAQKATFQSPDFIFYFTDVSHYNMAVDSNGSIALVDLDNVILMDKKNYISSISKSIHKSELFNEYDYAFSPTDICSHYLSDHNYFSVCLQLLTDPEHGLLNKIPKDLVEKYPELIPLLNECREPKTSPHRIEPGQKIQTLLENIIHNHSFVFRSKV